MNDGVNKMTKLAVVGATGLVGEKVLEVLDRKKYHLMNLYYFHHLDQQAKKSNSKEKLIRLKH